ncbi:MAG: ribosomal-processing cysteine protease Prp [Clostridia bacterium]|nr:ribosomal-processing cysteine protease Prp [Clostridia bacterium]
MIRGIYDEDELIIFLRGHANYAPRGKDIVCASVSALAFTYAAHLGTYRKTEDKMILWCKEKNQTQRRIFKAIVNGLSMISKSYPENFLLTKGRLSLLIDTQERLQKENKDDE